MHHPWSSQAFGAGARTAGRRDEMISAAERHAAAIKGRHPDLPVVLTLNHLAHLASVSAQDLQQVAFRKEDAYRVFRVKKRGSPAKISKPPRRYRTICVPKPFLMRTQRWIAQNILNPIRPDPASYAFAPGCDLVGAANRHLGARCLLNMDVRHFFESILEDSVYRVFRSLGYGALLSFQMARLCTRHQSERVRSMPVRDRSSKLPYPRQKWGHLPQGAPTSPMLANLAMRTLDRRLTSLAQATGWIYTRYADDLAFSRRDDSTRTMVVRLSRQVAYELELAGLIHHREKTRISPPGARKILLGVLIDREKPHLTRTFRANIETHLFALTSRKLGPAVHREKRGFASIIGMRRHIGGLIAFAHQVDPEYARKLHDKFEAVDWSR
jgi:RNA-directed DNA polymerase